jgi:hypothetical protein
MPRGEKKPVRSKTRTSNRRIKPRSYKSFRMSKRIHHPKGKLRGSFKIFAGSTQHLYKNWRVFGGITLVYLALTIVLVKGFAGGVGLAEIKGILHDTFQGSTAQLVTGLTLFGVLLGSAGSSSSETGATYQSILLIVFSVVLIWTLRQTFASKRVSVRDGFYKGLYPLIPFVLVLLVIGLQLIPLVVASTLYTIVIAGGLAVTATETILWSLLLFGLSLLSIYWLSSSLFALYIVTLPDMTPMAALRTARDLVRYRRWEVMRKVLFLPVALLLLAGIILLPMILYVTPAAEWLFFGLNMASLAIVHSYMYSLYRELL